MDVDLVDRSRTASEDGDFTHGSMAGLPIDQAIWSSGMPSPGLRTHALKCVNTLSGHHSGIRVIAVLNNRVFTGSYDNTIKVWNLDGGSCEATLEGHIAWIRSLFCHARDPLLFSGSDDGIIKVWRTDTFVHMHDILPPMIEGEEDQAANRGILAITVDYERSWCARVRRPRAGGREQQRGTGRAGSPRWRCAAATMPP